MSVPEMRNISSCYRRQDYNNVLSICLHIANQILARSTHFSLIENRISFMGLLNNEICQLPPHMYFNTYETKLNDNDLQLTTDRCSQCSDNYLLSRIFPQRNSRHVHSYISLLSQWQLLICDRRESRSLRLSWVLPAAAG